MGVCTYLPPTDPLSSALHPQHWAAGAAGDMFPVSATHTGPCSPLGTNVFI